MAGLGYSPGPLKRLYDRSPIAVQHALTTAYGFRLVRRVHGPAFRRHLARIERCQWLPRRELERRQIDDLRSFFQEAERHSPFWRACFARHRFNPLRFQVLEQLRLLPPLDKEMVRQNAEAMVAAPAREDRWPIVESRTSGTTGKALRIVLTRDAWVREHAYRWLHRSWAGIRWGARTATFAGHPVVPAEQDRPPFWRYNAAQRQLLFSSQHIGPETVAAYAERLREFRPALIHGYPSSLSLLARYLDGAGDEPIRPVAVFTHSETLLDGQREVIERAFGCKVFNWYGTSEHVGNIVECERGSLHVKLDHSLLEFVRPDGSPAAPGEEAEIWATGFANPAMPLIRYRVGDTVVLADGECACGRSGPLVARILGRVEDFIITPDGRHVGRLDHVFKAAPNVFEAQLLQESVEALDVVIVPRAEFTEGDRAAIEEELRIRLGPSIAIRFRMVPAIPREPNGKFRFAVSRMPIAIGARDRA